MTVRVLVPMDHSPLAEAALEEALETFPGGEFTVLHVIDYLQAAQGAKLLLGEEELVERGEERTEKLFERAREIAAPYGVEPATESRVGKPGREIVEYAETHNLDRVVLGSHGRNAVSKLVLGSVAERVIRESPVPVTVVR